MPKPADMRFHVIVVWICRLIVGVTFIISGWAKAIDPWGFLIKTGEYLQVWGLDLPREIVLSGCIALACVEFCTGILVATGSLKRIAVWVAAVMMSVMLPLTLYVAIASPVSDCGCFGDFIVISNTATFLKNVVLCALIVYLILFGGKVKGLYAPPIQWLVIAISTVFPMLLAFIGYNIQPLVDFRPYRLGSQLFGGIESTTEEEYVYTKDGEEKIFTLDNLPDDTWEFVEMKSSSVSDSPGGFEVRNEDGFEVNEELAEIDTPVLYLIIPDPDVQFLSRTHLTNLLYRRAQDNGMTMIGIVGASGTTLDRWVSLAKPLYKVYSASPTALKQLVRGDAAIVYTEEGVIKWKRTLSSLDLEPVYGESVKKSPLEVEAIDDGRLHLLLLAIYSGSLIIIYLLSLSPKILRFFMGHTKKNS